ncbi:MULTISPECIES: hypothetical protein [Caldimonas]|jgi:hypothetical protein|uniref:hypothetical protein n=1 Tax=Caldimonas TaxID=196013 RepID=UPI000366D86A|nr:hypothetical protein [Caldimonas manganoxidans]
MNRRTVFASLALAATAMGAAAPAYADKVYWSIGISSPGVTTTVSNARPIYHVAPPPAVVYPPVVYHAPAVVYPAPAVVYRPAPVVVHPAPVVAYPYPYYGKPRKHWRHPHD